MERVVILGPGGAGKTLPVEHFVTQATAPTPSICRRGPFNQPKS